MIDSQSTAISVTKDLLIDLQKQQAEIERVDRWYRVDMKHRNDRPFVPAKATREYRDLVGRSFTPWARLLVKSLAQGMYVDGYRTENDSDTPGWRAWQANRMDGRQTAVHRSTFAHALSYVDILPGSYRNPDTGNVEDMPVIRGRSARKMIAVFDDPASDDWPSHALRTEISGDDLMLWLYDEEVIHTLSTPRNGGAVTYIEHEPHGGEGVPPVVRFTNELDLDGRVTGEIAPVIPLLARIDQDTFDRLIVQRFGSWKTRWIAGQTEPGTDEEKRAAEIGLRVTDLLVSESPATKFGTLDATDLKGYIEARDADIRDLSATSQVPPHHLLGMSPNLAAEAVEAADAQREAKIVERQATTGESWEQVLEMATQQMGEIPDPSAQVRWRDVDSRSLAQTTDALGKLATMLNVPVQMLWQRIPGWTDQDVKEAEKLLVENSELTNMIAQIQGQQTPVTSSPDGTPPPD